MTARRFLTILAIAILVLMVSLVAMSKAHAAQWTGVLSMPCTDDRIHMIVELKAQGFEVEDTRQVYIGEKLEAGYQIVFLNRVTGIRLISLVDQKSACLALMEDVAVAKSGAYK
jgi:hypothetical protein